MTDRKVISSEVGSLENPEGLKNFKPLLWDTVDRGTEFHDETGKIFKVVDFDTYEYAPSKVRWISYTDRPGTDPKGRILFRPLGA